MRRYLIRCQSGAGHFDHGAHPVSHSRTQIGSRDHLIGYLADGLFLQLQLADVANQRYHDLRRDQHAQLVAHLDGRLHDGANLHARDVGMRDAQTTAAMSQHRIRLLQLSDLGVQFVHRQPELPANDALLFQRHVVRQKFVQRRIQQTDRHVFRLHDAVNRGKVGLLIRFEFVEDLFDALRVVAARGVLALFQQNHLSHQLDARLAEKHVLGATQSDALAAQIQRVLRVVRIVGIAANTQRLDLLRPLEQLTKLALLHQLLQIHVDHRQRALVHFAASAVQRDHVALSQRDHAAILLRCESQRGQRTFLVDTAIAAARHAARTHSACNHRRVARHSTVNGQDALSHVHSDNVFRRRLVANQNDALSAVVHLQCSRRIKHDFAHCHARRCRQTCAHRMRFLQHRLVKLLVQQLLDLVRVDPQQRRLFVDEAFVHHIHRHLDRRPNRPLSVPRLQNEQLAVLDGKLHVLHVLVMQLQFLVDLHQLVVHCRHHLGQLVNRQRSAHPAHYVFALRVHQKLAVKPLPAVRRIPRKTHSCARRLAFVSKHHRLHIHRRAHQTLVVQVVDITVCHCSRCVP
mmetsp:Transcript_18848/g.29945  ORF Transcript_18848/g.29945 Transcript_18848/m.29945 type:complete len:574 (+) Transcript_18848:585-2306(+)